MSNQIEEVEFETALSNLSKAELDYLLYLTLQKLKVNVLQMISYENTHEHFLNDDNLNKYTQKITEEYYNSLIDNRFFRHCETFEDCMELIIYDLDSK